MFYLFLTEKQYIREANVVLMSRLLMSFVGSALERWERWNGVKTVLAGWTRGRPAGDKRDADLAFPENA